MFNNLRDDVEILRDQVETLNIMVGPKYQLGVVTEVLTSGGFGKVRLKSPVWVSGSDSYELEEKPYTVDVYNPTDEDVEVDEQVNCCVNQWGVWIYVAGGGPDKSPIVPVTLTQSGGTQGDGTNPATWTYDITPALDPSAGVVMSAQDPVSSPHHYQRPNVGQVEKADFGLAWRKSIEPAPEPPAHPYEYELTWINEAIIGAICEEEEPPA